MFFFDSFLHLEIKICRSGHLCSTAVLHYDAFGHTFYWAQILAFATMTVKLIFLLKVARKWSMATGSHTEQKYLQSIY